VLFRSFGQAEFDILFGTGISREGDLLDLAVEHGLVKKSGAFYSYEETKLGQGRERAKEYLRANPEIADALESVIRDLHAAGELTPA